jgi:hypothetical protein
MTKAELKYGIRQIQEDETCIENMMVDILIDDLLRYDDQVDAGESKGVTIEEYLQHIGIEPTEDDAANGGTGVETAADQATNPFVQPPGSSCGGRLAQ